MSAEIKTVSDINEGLRVCRATEGAILVDVRREDEFAEGHIPGSRNIPLQIIPTVEGILTDKTAPVFLYCLSGGRSNRAAAFLTKVGYTDVTNLGGIKDYTGEKEI